MAWCTEGQVRSLNPKSLGASDDYERWKVTVHSAQAGWDDYRETTGCWLVC